MATRVLIPTPLRAYTEKKESVLLEGNTVGELLRGLTATYPSLKKHLFDDTGSIRYLQKEQTQVSEKDTMSIIPSIAGGRS